MAGKRKKLSLCFLAALLVFALVGCGGNTPENVSVESRVSVARPQLQFWYTDEALTEFLEAASFAYTEVDDEVRVVPVLVSGTEFINKLYEASLEEGPPDLFLIGNDLLEKAYLAGLADPPPLPELPQSTGLAEPQPRNVLVNKDRFPEAAVFSCTCNGRPVAYPFYFQTSAFLYNKTYLEEMGESQPPSTIREIQNFAFDHDAPEGLETFFSWDVNDIFYNFFFVGGVMELGGEAGDDLSRLNINNPEAVRALGIYQELNQFFSIESGEVNSDAVLEDFKNGKLLFTVVTTNACSGLAEAKEKGEMNYEYAFSTLPDVDEGIPSRSLSVTEAVCVNGYGGYIEKSHQFAAFLVSMFSKDLYARTGKVPAFRESAQAIPELEAFLQEYEDSVPVPKMIETGALWVKLESAFTKIWEGADVEQELKALEEEIS